MTRFFTLPYRSLCVLSVLITMGAIFLYWPGFLSPDTLGQLNQAISGEYGDHHPPLMSLYWRLWTWWRAGPEPMLISHQLLLLASVLTFLRAMKGQKISTFIPFIPLCPHIFFYSGALWKDVGFTFPYLCVASILTFHSIHNIPLKKGWLSIIWILLFYGTGVKYQAIFVLPIISLWVSISLKYKKWIFTILAWAALWATIIGANEGLKKALVDARSESHSWQKVKLYDLAGISIRLNQDLFPGFVREKPCYSFEKVKTMYSSYRVDEMLSGWHPQGSLEQGQTEEERSILWGTWFRAVKKYPLIYLKHRFGVWKNMVSRSPLKSVEELKDVDALPTKVRLTLKFLHQSSFLTFLKKITCFVYWIPILAAYLFLGFFYLRKNPSYAVPLLFMNLSGAALLLVLFVFSMASDLRYIYLTMTFLHFSHPLAWGTLFYNNKERGLKWCAREDSNLRPQD